MNNKKRKKVLIIYENNGNCLRWRKYLKDINYEVVYESDYTSGWMKYKEVQPSVVLLGLNVNDQEGFGEFLIKKMKSKKNIWVPVFIILPDNIYWYLSESDIRSIPYIYPCSGVRTPYFLESVVSPQTLAKKIRMER